MEDSTINLATQLFNKLSREQVDDLVELLKYYNRMTNPSERVQAMFNGTTDPRDLLFEREVQSKVARAQDLRERYQLSYITNNSSVCKYCGK